MSAVRKRPTDPPPELVRLRPALCVDYIYNSCRGMGFDPWAFSDVISDVMRRAPDTAWETLAHRVGKGSLSERERSIVLDYLAARGRKGSL